MKDIRLDDPINGPEFSVRIMTVCKAAGIETVGQLRAQLDRMEYYRGIGRKSMREIRDYFRQLDRVAQSQDRAIDIVAQLHEVQTVLIHASRFVVNSPNMRKVVAKRLRAIADGLDK